MTYDVEHHILTCKHLICLLAICITSLVRCLLRSLAHFLINSLFFLFLSLMSSLYILYNSSLSDMSFEDICTAPPPQFVVSHSLDSVLLRVETFDFNETELSIVFYESCL